MTACADGSCAVRYLTRAEKREEFGHDPAKPQETWMGLRDDLIRIGYSYHDYTAKVPQLEQSLHDAWDELIHAAKIIPSTSSEHDRLVTLVLELRELGFFHRKSKDSTSSSKKEAAVMSNGQRLWIDLPFLAEEFQNFWMTESHWLSVDERQNLAVVTAKLCATGICSGDLAKCALWLFKEALEKESPSATDPEKNYQSGKALPGLAELLPACLQWLNNASHQLARLSAEDHDLGSLGLRHDDDQVLTPGSLATAAGVSGPAFSMTRWLFWRERLGDLYLLGGDNVSQLARQCFEAMVGTGLGIGIEIPGEKAYMRRVFEALDKELVARGSVECVGPEDIEIDPKWASEQ